MRAPKLPIHHVDQLGQPIETGDYIAFSYAYSSGIKIGRVVKLTQQRVRIVYRHQYTSHAGDLRIAEWTYLARPDRTMVLNTTLDQQLVIMKLKNLVP